MLFFRLLTQQKVVAMIAEMMHTASLYHDDVIDGADLRRGKPSANVLWNHKRVSTPPPESLLTYYWMINQSYVHYYIIVKCLRYNMRPLRDNIY